jgi:UDP-N-acetylmuramoylalanine--D-glutamate ligase
MSQRELAQPFAPALQAPGRIRAIRERLKRPGLEAVVVGAGKSGLAAAELLKARGARVTLLDDQPGKAQPIEQAVIDAAELVVLSPGVPRARPEFKIAIVRGTLVSEIELASWFVSPEIGITGTNGKSTTTALVAHLLQNCGLEVFAGGNLGRPLSEVALSTKRVEAVVVELSSYQLESLVDARFSVTCWLNLTPDHVDRYPDVATYAAAKRRLLECRHQDGVAVLNAKDRWCVDAGVRLGGNVRWFAAGAESDLAGPIGTLASSELAIRTDWDRQETYRITNPALLGVHNRANACAAIECARAHPSSRVEGVQHGLDTFPGLPHRIERVAVIDEVTWYNDSKATNVDSAVTGVRAIGAPKILIAGGKDKGSSWAPLVEAAKENKVKLVLAIGAALPIVAASFRDSGIDVREVQTLDRAVAVARQLAKPGDAVLLSPACASFDQFKNFEDRGDQFRAMVQAMVGGHA